MPSRRQVSRLLATLATAAWASGALGAAEARAQEMELLMFEEPGCPWCRRWHQEVGPAYPNTPEGRSAPLRVVDIGARIEGVQLASRIRFSPTFVLVRQGREVGRINGYPGADFFWPALGDLLAKAQAGG